MISWIWSHQCSSVSVGERPVIADQYFYSTPFLLIHLSSSNTGSSLEACSFYFTPACLSHLRLFLCIFSSDILLNPASNKSFFGSSVTFRYGHGFEMFCLASDSARMVVASACKVSVIRHFYSILRYFKMAA